MTVISFVKCRAGILRGLALLVFLLPSAVRAVPSFARQTGLQCIVCHTQFPELTAFGHQFKLSGYILGGSGTELPPIAIMLQPSLRIRRKASRAARLRSLGQTIMSR